MPSLRADSGIALRTGADHYGRLSVPGAAPTITNARIRRWAAGGKDFIHRTKNGFNDPYTHYHLLREVMHQQEGHRFTAAQLADHMNYVKPEFLWDAVTIGRILGDWVDSWNDANNRSPVLKHRFYDGVYYETVGTGEAIATMAHLLDDLATLCEETQGQEAIGNLMARPESPLVRCPSVVDPLAAIA